MLSPLRLALAGAFAVLALAAPSLVAADCGIGSIKLNALSNQDFIFTDTWLHEWLVRPCAPTTNAACVKGGPLTSSCKGSTAYGYWTTDLWHKWTFMNPDEPSQGVQVYMEGSSAPGCNDKNVYFSFVQFPCAATQGTLTVVEGSGCQANFTLPTPLSCHNPGLVLFE